MTDRQLKPHDELFFMRAGVGLDALIALGFDADCIETWKDLDKARREREQGGAWSLKSAVRHLSSRCPTEMYLYLMALLTALGEPLDADQLNQLGCWSLLYASSDQTKVAVAEAILRDVDRNLNR